LQLLAARPGVFRGQCAEYCGGPHALMALYVIAEEPDAYARWAQRQREPIAAPAGALGARGAELFMRRCAACHTVRGTPAEGERGPDLTHLATRGTIAAGLLPTNSGTVAAWVSTSQHLKPQNLMPSFHDFSGVELRALAAFLLAAE
jgi:cytochrome c oxidase subunit 2